MKKVVLGLMLVMGLSLVGCGNAKEEVVNGGGFTPSKPSTETVVETEKEEINLEMTVEEMKEYYNDNQFVGTPRVAEVKALYDDFRESAFISCSYFNEKTECWNSLKKSIESLEKYGLKRDSYYYAIVVDNGTPDDYTDDEIAYIFTTPIEK